MNPLLPAATSPKAEVEPTGASTASARDPYAERDSFKETMASHEKNTASERRADSSNVVDRTTESKPLDEPKPDRDASQVVARGAGSAPSREGDPASSYAQGDTSDELDTVNERLQGASVLALVEGLAEPNTASVLTGDGRDFGGATMITSTVDPAQTKPIEPPGLDAGRGAALGLAHVRTLTPAGSELSSGVSHQRGAAPPVPQELSAPSGLTLAGDASFSPKLASLTKDASQSSVVALTPLSKGVGEGPSRANFLASSSLSLEEKALLSGGDKSGAFNVGAEELLGSSLDKANVQDHRAALSSVNGLMQTPAAAINAPARVQMPVNISFGQPAWAEMVAERSAMMASQNIKFAELQLDPPELGPLQVKVTVHHDQTTVSFVSANGQVRDALDGAANRLRDLLEQQGLDLVDVDVSDQATSEGEGEASEEENITSGEEGLSENGPEVKHSSVVAGYGVDHYA